MASAWTTKDGNRYRGRYRDPDGNDCSAGSHATKKLALEAAHEALAKSRKINWVDPKVGKITFSQYFENHWLPNVVLADYTKISYESTYNAHLKDAFGEMELRKILPSTVQGWVVRLERSGDFEPSTIHKFFGHLQSILAGRKGVSAMNDRLLEESPCARVRLPFVPRREVKIYTPAEVDLLIDTMDPWWRAIPLFWSGTGVRWGELVGLLVDDFTLGARRVTISHTIIEVGKKRSGNGTVFKEKPYPKTYKPRSLGLDPDTSRAINELIEARGLEPGDRLFSMPTKRKYGTPDLVLDARPLRTKAWPGGVPISKSFFTKSVWHRTIAAAELPYRRPYDLRASHISWLLAGGAPIPVVMERVGHTKMETTMGYTVAIDTDREALNALDNVRQLRPRTTAQDNVV